MRQTAATAMAPVDDTTGTAAASGSPLPPLPPPSQDSLGRGRRRFRRIFQQKHFISSLVVIAASMLLALAF